jgi:endonuclease YncB( thermonuclease family)
MILWKEDPAPAPPQARQEAQGRAMKTVRVARISAIAFGLFVVAASATQSAEFASGIPRIVDGDTVQIGGTKIRFAGIDAPETDQVCLDAKGEKWACGVTARDELIKYSAGRSWDCDLVGSDRYGRSLGKCFIEGGDISAWMVRSGWALSFVRYSHDYDRDEEIAREANQAALAKGGTYSFAYEGEQLKTGRTALVAGFNLCNDFATFVCENRSSVGTERRAVPAQRASSREGRSSGRRIRQTVGRHHLLPGERSERVVRAGASETAVAGQGMRVVKTLERPNGSKPFARRQVWRIAGPGTMMAAAGRGSI